MDESWKMRMGMTDLPRRRSTEETSTNRPKQSVFGSDFKPQDPEDFSDVFGGPPRSVLWRQCSGDIKPRTRSDSFYEEIFQTPESIAPTRSGRNLPVFRIPVRRGGLQRSEVFYSDVFGSVQDRRSRSRSKSKTNSKSKSKSNSSSVLSSEDMSPLRPAISDDIGFSSFASKLRPINVPFRWNSASTMPEEHQKKRGMPVFPCQSPSFMEDQFMETEFPENLRSSHFQFSRQFPSPESINLKPNSYGSFKLSVEDIELNSPSSGVSSLSFPVPEIRAKAEDTMFQEQMEVEDDEVMSSYVIELTSEHREVADEAVDVGEAIAWAKEKFQTSSSEKELIRKQLEKEQFFELGVELKARVFEDREIVENRIILSLGELELKNQLTDDKFQLDGDVRL